MTQAPASLTGNAIVISHFGNEVLIENDRGERLRAVPRQHLPELVTGDRIVFERPDSGLAVITALAQRHGILTRSTRQQPEKIIASNIDLVAIVSAAKPALKTGLIDRYLVACELAGLKAIIIFNKLDLCDSGQFDAYKNTLAPYAEIGYPVQYVSAKQHKYLDALREALAGKNVILVGHSGVGKSSLIDALLPDAQPRIGEVSAATNKGRHTTTHTELYALPDGGHIIDSPGIREFGLKPVDAQTLAEGFIEFRSYLGQCKFRDCTHHNEPGCAVREAVRRGEIRAARLESYLAILASFNE